MLILKKKGRKKRKEGKEGRKGQLCTPVIKHWNGWKNIYFNFFLWNALHRHICFTVSPAWKKCRLTETRCSNDVQDFLSPIKHTKLQNVVIGGSRGGVPSACPLRVQILSFRHTKFSKHNCLSSPHPLWGPRLPTGNPGLPTGCRFLHSL